jgi:cell division protein FtsL
MHVRAADPMGFAINPVIPNRPIAQEIDRTRQRELLRWLGVGAVVVAAALFDGFQRYGIVSYSLDLGKVQTARAAEEVKARQLRLELETLRAPGRIETLARQLSLVSPGPDDAVVIERVVPAPAPPSSVVASR